MHIKIYFDDKPVFLCDELTEELKEILHHPDAIFIDEFSGPAIKSLLHEITKPDFHAGVLLHSSLEELKKAFFKHFTPIEAAGGVVQNDKNQLLFIYRLAKWDLPKGKVETGEHIEKTALREIEEETGLKHLTLHSKIGETYHTYNAYGKHFLKTTHWYFVTCSAKQKMIPQTEEDITAIEWVNPNKMDLQLNNTYPSIKDILSVLLKSGIPTKKKRTTSE
ncbi:MAG: hydrolase [Ferruginibacter sp.]|jgi:8-oxo-dGTP pyrophosphatase MutT (NUDIX family)|uniref:NUDIX hydrolase n=1 Tax=Ferruginibacter sp. TaxID=1940288 RepID=UPI00265892CF|nr:NUDIX domain-containing protein [Ferruginibacter sp.]MDB5278666.1 hydrolase [Ferruginibacter sp.]